MREIKFRAFVNGKMEYNVMLNIHGVYGVFDDGKLVLALPDVPVMQYTGLKDKNGKECYDGDIITGRYGQREVEFENGGFYPFGENVFSEKNGEFEIIGNIYEKYTCNDLSLTN